MTSRQPSEESDTLIAKFSPVTPGKRPDTLSHGVEWFRREVLFPVGEAVSRHTWRVCTRAGHIIADGCGIMDYSPYNCFLTMFSHDHLLKIVDPTSIKLQRIGRPTTCPSEILRNFGILILITRFEFGTRKTLWNINRNSKYIPPAEFGKTGMPRNWFEDLTRCIAFSYQPNEQGDLSSVRYRWLLVQDFLTLLSTIGSDMCSRRIYCA